MGKDTKVLLKRIYHTVIIEDNIHVFTKINNASCATHTAWQGTPENAAVAGDFTMLADEVEPVINALVANGIEVVALHNHMIQEEPRIFFLHYWGTGQVDELARGLREALNQTGN